MRWMSRAVARSMMELVGGPALQKPASTVPSRMPFAVSLKLSLWGSKSSYGIPLASSSVRAPTSVPLPGAPTETRRPTRSASESTPLPSRLASCSTFG
jgi:hypothetical protein